MPQPLARAARPAGPGRGGQPGRRRPGADRGHVQHRAALLGDIADDADFLAGYAEGGGPVVLDGATRARLHLYRAHLELVMVVETVPRGTDGPEHAEWSARVANWLVQELDALWSG